MRGAEGGKRDGRKYEHAEFPGNSSLSVYEERQEPAGWRVCVLVRCVRPRRRDIPRTALPNGLYYIIPETPTDSFCLRRQGAPASRRAQAAAAADVPSNHSTTLSLSLSLLCRVLLRGTQEVVKPLVGREMPLFQYICFNF